MRIESSLTEESLEFNSQTLEVSQSESIYYDFSKSHLGKNDYETIKDQIVSKGLVKKIEDMWRGEKVNFTEERPVLHYLLREKSILEEVEAFANSSQQEETPKKAKHDSEDLIEAAKNEISEELKKICTFTKDFKNLKGVTEKSFDTIVNIGIGGSDLGPRMVTEALQFYSEDRKVHFISNVDSSDTIKTFRSLDPEKTLFIVVSKTFTTIETIENFKLALSLFKSMLQNKYTEHDICSRHFVAVSSNIPETDKYGIKTVFKMWDFVGGRYSLWSAVGLSISLYIGFDNYLKLLKGASAADKEFYTNKEKSIPMKMAINELYYTSKGFNNKCIVSYDSYLELFYKYLQQAEMESNGKHGSKQMIIWGGVGTDVQHSFFQLLHQGEQNVYLEFLCPRKNINIESYKDDKVAQAVKENAEMINYHHKLLVASCFAQSRSLLIGKRSGDINNHFEGDKPSVTIMYSMMSPEVLGAMLAVYEHKIFIHGIFYDINSFDQFGVQLGKTITNDLIKSIMDNESSSENLDLSTKELIKKLTGK